MKKITIILFALIITFGASAQDKKFGIEFHGFVKSDFSYDTRQTTAAREGHFLLWPKEIVKDANNKDINDNSVLTFLAIQSRLSAKITGPKAFGAKTTGLIEGDFFGQTNGNINLFRLRHAFLKLNWEKSELLLGQYWNPLFVTGCFPATISFNTGAPIQPFARNPQMRFTYGGGKLKVMVAALGQRDYVTTGPTGGTSTYLRNSTIPDMHLQVHYKKENEEKGTGVNFGLGGATKTITPRISVTNNNGTFKVDESVMSMSALAFANIKTKKLTFKVVGIYGENLSDVLSITGFAVKEILDTLTKEQSYTPTSSVILWTDIHTNGKKWQFGVFAGVNKYLGTRDKMSFPENEIYSLPQVFNQKDISMLYRISPRVIFNSGKARFAAELEYTYADFGINDANGDYIRDLNGIPTNTEGVSNLRFLLAAYLFF